MEAYLVTRVVKLEVYCIVVIGVHSQGTVGLAGGDARFGLRCR